MDLKKSKLILTTKLDKAQNIFRYNPTEKNLKLVEASKEELKQFHKDYQIGLKTTFKEGIKPKNKKGKFTKSRCVNDGERTYKPRKKKEII